MLTGQQYLELVNSRGKRGLTLQRVYRNIRREDLFMAAYNKLYANQGATTPGSDPKDTVDGMSIRRIRSIIQDLEDGRYRWKPTRRTYIQKANGKLRPLSMPCWKDKMVQEVLRMVLEAYYEPQFSDNSHGFRPKRGCHTALKEIAYVWRGTKWFIEGDIKGCFDNIDHDTLLGIVTDKVQDVRLLKLLRQMLKAGYLEEFQYNRTMSGTPQGGVISPLLANIYLDRLDQYIETELLPKYNKGTGRCKTREYRRLQSQRERLKKQGEMREASVVFKQMQQVRSTDPMDPNYRRLRYIRYADDFLLGFAGPKQEALEIKQAIGHFLQEQMKLEMAEEKTSITHAATKPAHFLGYNIHVSWDNTKKTNGRRSVNGMVTLRLPREVRMKWHRKYMEKGKPASRTELITMTDYDIAMQYESELRGIANYYELAVNVSMLYQLKHVMMDSLARTLANKHKASRKVIYRRHSIVFEDTGMRGMLVELTRNDKPSLYAKFGRNPIRYKRTASTLKDEIWFRPKVQARTELSDRLTAEECELCGSHDQVEVHHIRKLKDLQRKYYRKNRPLWIEKMITRRRKTLVVCHRCHQAIHNGKYDGRAITS